MTDRVKSLEQEVVNLSERDFKRFARWFWDYDDRKWVEQMTRDAESGKLDFLVQEARAEYDSGETREI